MTYSNPLDKTATYMRSRAQNRPYLPQAEDSKHYQIASNAIDVVRAAVKRHRGLEKIIDLQSPKLFTAERDLRRKEKNGEPLPTSTYALLARICTAASAIEGPAEPIDVDHSRKAGAAMYAKMGRLVA